MNCNSYGNSSQAVSTVGYGDNDESLGGPFIGDDTLVYEIQTPVRQYWRVETKDYYTSKGWIHTGSQALESTLQLSDVLPLSIAPGDEEAQTVEVHAMQDNSFLLQAYGTTAYQMSQLQSMLKFNQGNEKINAMINNKEMYPVFYGVTFQQPEYSYTALKESRSSTESDPRFLQLPDELPKRVIDLAHEITDSYDSVYEKARAIEDYFARNGFQYETTNVQVPAANEDYVDQFLFETKLGYCDNFSTSMIVLLRSVGIQARWVKGFASGERVASADGIHTYKVTNNDAHSWVEAYIDGIGWMPFEPTIGFSNPMNIDYDVEFDQGQEEQLPEREEEELPQPDREELDQQTTGGTTSAFDFSKFQWVFYILGAALIIFAIVLWRKRGKWQPKLIVQTKRSNCFNKMK